MYSWKYNIMNAYYTKVYKYKLFIFIYYETRFVIVSFLMSMMTSVK